MVMKLLLICIILCVISISAGLSPNIQKKLVDELNKDRKAYGVKMNKKMVTITYDPTLEKLLDSVACSDFWKHQIVELKHNGSSKRRQDNPSRRYVFFNPNQTTIGCSETLKCDWEDKENNNLKGAFHGACAFGVRTQTDMSDQINSGVLELPSIMKYADIIGVDKKKKVDKTKKEDQSDSSGESEKGKEEAEKKSSGRVLNFIFSIFLVFFI